MPDLDSPFIASDVSGTMIFTIIRYKKICVTETAVNRCQAIFSDVLTLISFRVPRYASTGGTVIFATWVAARDIRVFVCCVVCWSMFIVFPPQTVRMICRKKPVWGQLMHGCLLCILSDENVFRSSP